jgi:hypothetical protein
MEATCPSETSIAFQRNTWRYIPQKTAPHDHRSENLKFCLWLYNPCGPWPLFRFLNLCTVGRTPWTGDQPVARPLPTHAGQHKQNKRTQTSMPRMGSEPTIPAFERPKAFHALDRAATVIGEPQILHSENVIWIEMYESLYLGTRNGYQGVYKNHLLL